MMREMVVFELIPTCYIHCRARLAYCLLLDVMDAARGSPNLDGENDQSTGNVCAVLRAAEGLQAEEMGLRVRPFPFIRVCSGNFFRGSIMSFRASHPLSPHI